MNADRINEHYYGELLHPTTQRCRQRIHWICGQIEGQKVLDVGCSQGITCLLLGREGFDCTGVDIEEAAISRARQELDKEEESVRKRVRFLVGDANSLPFGDESFDSVVLCEILEHLTHPERVLKEVRRVLKDKGKLIITVPHGVLAHHDHKRTFYPLSLLAALRPFFRTTLIESLHSMQLICCGKKDESYRPEDVTNGQLLKEFQDWTGKLEERCSASEMTIVETTQRLNDQIKGLREQLAQRDEALKKHQEVLAERERQTHAIEGDLAGSREMASQLRESVREVEAEAAQRSERLRELEREVVEKDGRIAELETRGAQLESALAAIREERTRMESELGARTSRIGELEATDTLKDTRIQALESGLEKAQTSELRLRSELAEAMASAAGNAATVRELRDGLAAGMADFKEAQASLETARALATELRVAAAKREAEAAEQTARVQELQASIVAKEGEMRRLEKELREALDAVSVLRAAGVKSDAETKAQAKQIQEQQAIIEAKKAAIQKLEQVARDAQSLVADLRTKVAKAEAEFAGQAGRMLEVERNLAAREKDIKRLEAALEEARRPVAALRQELVAKDAAWQQRFTKQLQELTHQHEAEWKRRLSVERIREIVRSSLPPEARVLVISKGDDELLKLDGRLGWHFPQTTGGVYAGFHPANSAEAIAHLETLRGKGAEYLLVPGTSFWWLDFYTEFRRHLESNYRLLTYNEEACLIFSLNPMRPERKPLLALSLQTETHSNGVKPKGLGAPAPALAAGPVPPALPAVTPGASGELAAGVAVQTARAPKKESADSRKAQEAPPRVTSPLPASERLARTARKLKVACILDEFTAACFRPECDLITFRPDNWKSVLNATPPDLLFVESAWQGNGGSWQYKIASFKKPMGEELVDVVGYCRERGIPTVFWNKEDPSHFDRFIHRAPLFDIIFTSDADMIPKYCDAVKHERVYALPFAAQPQLHNPVVDTVRRHMVCFAGAYYALDHDERRRDIEHILRPALQYGLHIYDRQHGVVGESARHYQFPEIYKPAIRGRLEYDEMVKAYKWYKVFLNVNSVKHSPTMCSRRVFELLASGTPVVSSYAKGIVELLGGELVHISNSESDTAAHLERLLQDDQYWWRISVKGIREVSLHHTYAHRFGEICAKAGLPEPEVESPALEAMARVSSAREVDQLIAMLKRQSVRGIGLTVAAGNQVARSKLEKIQNALPDIPVKVLGSRESLANRAGKLPGETYLWSVDPGDYYGSNFIGDTLRAIGYSDAEVVGKRACHEYDPATKAVKLARSGDEFRFVKALTPGSIVARAGAVDPAALLNAANSELFAPRKGRVLALDRFNFVKHGARIAGGEAATCLEAALA
jgi:2-polyprenyl-3-methyl-5-hydroxy-6-metoxy-1,4-benzoquinol methylase/spore maturation protein CgeB